MLLNNISFRRSFTSVLLCVRHFFRHGAVLRLAGAVDHPAGAGVADRRSVTVIPAKAGIDATFPIPSETGVAPALRADDAARWYRRPEIAAAEIGWWFGFGYFVPGLFWVGEAFLVEAETFAVLLPFAVTLLPAGLALFYGAATGLAARFWTGGARRVLVLALTLSAAEWLRGHVLSGLPWNTLGYALTFPLPLMQSAAVLGIYGLTLVAVLVFALPPVLWSEAAAGNAGRRHAGRRAGPGLRAARRDGAARPGAPVARATGDRARRQDPHRAAERAAAGEVAPREPGAHLPRSPGALGHQPRRRHRQSRRRDARHLARSRHAVPAARLPRRARRHRPRTAAGRVPHHGRAAGGARAAGRAAAAAHLQQHPGVRRGGLARRAATTRPTSCRSANTCRCSRCWKPSGCSSSPACAAASMSA